MSLQVSPWFFSYLEHFHRDKQCPSGQTMCQSKALSLFSCFQMQTSRDGGLGFPLSWALLKGTKKNCDGKQKTINMNNFLCLQLTWLKMV